MFAQHFPLILASASPRRQAFLSQYELQFEVIPAAIDETFEKGEAPEAFACRMAAEKAESISRRHRESCVIGADTIVVQNDQILGKPDSPEDALTMLRKLNGRSHQVITGTAVILPSLGIHHVFAVHTEVVFDHFDDTVLAAYVECGDSMDKAGAYGIQSQGGFLVKSIEGSYSNVVGLPVNRLIHFLLQEKIISPRI